MRNKKDLITKTGQRQKREKELPFPFFSIMLWSLVATAISVVLPFIFGLVSPQQTQDLYTGWALHQNGQMYTDYFGTNGLLYYLLTYLSLGSILLALVGVAWSVGVS